MPHLRARRSSRVEHLSFLWRGIDVKRMTQKILVVDDEAEIVRLVRAYLERAGFAVVTASEGRQALAVFRHERPNLVVLDLNLPGMDGLDVCRALRRDSDVPIIMLTARIEETDRLIGLEWAPTITSSSLSARARSWPACARSCAAARGLPSARM